MTGPVPRYPDVGLVGFVPDIWGMGYWQSRHHVMTRLARQFRVAWVDQPYGWRTHWLPGPTGLFHGPDGDTPPPGIELIRSTRWLPGMYRPRVLAHWVNRQRVRRAVRHIRRRGARRVILYLWRPEFDFVLDAVPHAVSCYHLDDEYTFLYTLSERDLPVPGPEVDLLRRVDEVIVHSPGLMEKKGCYNPHTTLIPNGVDFAAYSTALAEPNDLRDIPHPRVGYVGIVKDELDGSLLLHLARHHTAWSFVFVGPTQQFKRQAAVFADLLQMDNVFHLGRKPMVQLPAYAQHIDVGLLPYLENDYTQYIYPVKLHEYLATGRPVVGSPIPSLQMHADVVRLARSPEEWSAAITAALQEPRGGEATERRREVARQHDWNVLADRIADILVARLLR
jgi:glycosyltransferase involved in cell wall biosynthesis